MGKKKNRKEEKEETSEVAWSCMGGWTEMHCSAIQNNNKRKGKYKKSIQRKHRIQLAFNSVEGMQSTVQPSPVQMNRSYHWNKKKKRDMAQAERTWFLCGTMPMQNRDHSIHLGAHPNEDDGLTLSCPCEIHGRTINIAWKRTTKLDRGLFNRFSWRHRYLHCYSIAQLTTSIHWSIHPHNINTLPSSLLSYSPRPPSRSLLPLLYSCGSTGLHFKHRQLLLFRILHTSRNVAHGPRALPHTRSCM